MWVAFHTYLRERRGKKTNKPRYVFPKVANGIFPTAMKLIFFLRKVFFEEESLPSLGMERLFFTNCFYP